MPVNRNALIRYRTIDTCLRSRQRKWTLEGIMEACSDVLFEYEGSDKGVSKRTIQADIETMRSGKLGYEAPIVVVDKKYYTYSDRDFSITNRPLTPQDLVVLSEASSLLRQFKGLPHAAEVEEMITRLEDKVHAQSTQSRRLVDFERNDNLRGLHWIEVLRQYMIAQQSCKISYKSFRAKQESTFHFSPYLLKEYRNRWFALGASHDDPKRMRTLALDRIEEITNTVDPDGLYIPNTTIDLDTFYNNVIGVTRDIVSKAAKVIFTANSQNAPYIITKPLHPTQRVMATEHGRTTFIIEVILNLELERELLGFGAGVEVLSPRILRKRIKDALRSASEQYGDR